MEWESYETFWPGYKLLSGRRSRWFETIMRRRFNGRWQYRETTPREAEKALYGPFKESKLWDER